MNKDIRVLLLEDSEIDAELLLRQLRQAGYAPAMERIEDEVSFEDQLGKGGWDLIICDYRLPTYSAPQALELLKERGLDIPFLVVSGMMSPEMAVDMMKKGAHDYITKGDLNRLVPAMERELLESTRRRELARAEQERRDTLEELRRARDELEERVRVRTQEISAANARLRELDRLKSEFLATMSHELRTPLNSILGFTTLLREGMAGPVNEEQTRQLGIVYGASKHLLGLINDLLDVSRIEAGHLPIDNKPYDFAGVVAEAVAQMKPQAIGKRLPLRPQLPQGRLEIEGDRRRVLQILLNLLHNAIKFTETGSIDLIVQADARQVSAEIVDTGVGMRSDQVEHVFEAFRQGDSSARRAYQGTGLGLYLCHKLLTLMGGEITLQSTPGQGTRVRFTLPRQPGTDSSAPSTIAANAT